MSKLTTYALWSASGEPEPNVDRNPPECRLGTISYQHSVGTLFTVQKKNTQKMVSLKLSLCSVVVCKVTLQNNEGGYVTVYAETHTKTLQMMSG